MPELLCFLNKKICLCYTRKKNQRKNYKIKHLIKILCSFLLHLREVRCVRIQNKSSKFSHKFKKFTKKIILNFELWIEKENLVPIPNISHN